MVVLATTLTFVLYGFATSVGVHAVPTASDTLAARAAVHKISRAVAGLLNLGISENCQNAVTTLINSPASTCLNIPGTVAIISTVPGSSWIPPTNSWLSEFCAADTCSNAQLMGTVGMMTDACAAELATYGISKDYVIQQALMYYPVAKSAVCLRDTNNRNELCAISSLQSLQVSLGGSPLTPELVSNAYPLLLNNNFMLARQLACTQCASAAFSLLRPLLPQQFLSTIDSFVGNQCGADFTSVPTGSLSVVTGSAARLAAQATAAVTSSATMLSVRGAMATTGIISVLATLASLL